MRQNEIKIEIFGLEKFVPDSKILFKTSMKSANTGVNLIKLFWCKFAHTFQKAISFQSRKIMVTLLKWSSLQKGVSKFTPKKFYEIDPWDLYHKTYYGYNLQIPR